MGLFSTPAAAVDPKLESVLIGGTPADLKRVGKAQEAILGALAPAEQLIFVAASTSAIGGGTVWAFTDQRLLATLGKSLEVDLPLSKISHTTIKYQVIGNRDVRYTCYVYSRGPLRHVSGFVGNAFTGLERMNGEDEIQRIAALIDARLEG